MARHGISKTRECLMEKRLEVFQNGGNDTENMGLLDMLDFVVVKGHNGLVVGRQMC